MKVGPKKAKVAPKPIPQPEQNWWIVGSPNTGFNARWASRAEVLKLTRACGGRECLADVNAARHRQLIERELLRWLTAVESRPPYTQRLDAQEAAKKLRVELKPGDPCASKGCPNRKNQGTFVGDYCAACHVRLTRTPWVPAQPGKAEKPRVKPRTPTAKKPTKKTRR